MLQPCVSLACVHCCCLVSFFLSLRLLFVFFLLWIPVRHWVALTDYGGRFSFYIYICILSTSSFLEKTLCWPSFLSHGSASLPPLVSAVFTLGETPAKDFRTPKLTTTLNFQHLAFKKF